MGEDKKPIVLSVVTEAAKLNPDTFEVLEMKQELSASLISQLFKDLVHLQAKVNQIEKEDENTPSI